jgi:hypothetical protein
MRNLKPEFFRDKKIAQLGPDAALIYQALWCLADDGGVAPIDPSRVWGEMFVGWPSISFEVVRQALILLSEAGRIRPFVSGDELYALIPTFPKHQRPKHPSEFRHPTSDQWVTAEYIASLPLYAPGPTPDAGVKRPPVISYQVSGNRYQVSGSSAQNGAETAGDEPSGSWSAAAVDCIRAAALPYQIGRVLRILRPFVDRDGPDVALAHFREFCKVGRHFDDKGEYLETPGPMTLLRPERFRDSYDEWKPSERSVPA